MTNQKASPTAKPTNLLARMAAIDLTTPRDFNFPTDNRVKTVVGTASEDVQRLFCLAFDLCAELAQMTVETHQFSKAHFVTHHDGTDTDEKCAAFHEALDARLEEIDTMKSLIDSAKNIMWGAVALEFPETADEESLDMRDGWQIVVIEQEESRNPFRDLFGDQLEGDLGQLSELLTGGRVNVTRF